MEEKEIEMRNIYKKFGNVNALNDVDLSLNKGEVLGLVTSVIGTSITLGTLFPLKVSFNTFTA